MKEDNLNIYYHIINDKWYVSVEDYKKIKNRIDKAIEYIEKNSYTTYETYDDINLYIVRLDTCDDLLDILKGVDKDEN